MRIDDVSQTTDWLYQISFTQKLSIETRARFEELFLEDRSYQWFDQYTLMIGSKLPK